MCLCVYRQPPQQKVNRNRNWVVNGVSRFDCLMNSTFEMKQ